MQYSFQQIAHILKAEILCGGDLQQQIKYSFYDSRKISNAADGVFFAIHTKKNNGHQFIPDAINQGVRAFIISDKSFFSDNSVLQDNAGKYNVMCVHDTLLAMQQLAAFHRKQFAFPVIGITGSNGKTVVKEWLYQLLNKQFNIIRSPLSFNSQVGVPVSVMQLEPYFNLAIFEAGISQPGEMQALEKIICPDVALITNIGNAHSENFKDHFQKTLEKLHLFENAKTIVYCEDDEYISNVVNEKNWNKQKQIFSWSQLNQSAAVYIAAIDRQQNHSVISFQYRNNTYQYQIPFADEASIENSIHCLCLALHLNVNIPQLLPAFNELYAVAMRLELKKGINQCSVINDCYTSDIDSLKVAIDFIMQQQQHKNKTIILSDMLQSSIPSEQLYAEVAALINNKNISRVIGIGSEIKKYSNHFKCEKLFFDNTDIFLAEIKHILFQNEAILLKGARIFEFEKIARQLELTTHETVMEINLSAMVENLNFFRKQIPPGTKIMAMVKAFSYGSGSFEIANILQFHHIDYLAVAFIDEGIELRKAGIKVPIMVMSPEESGFEQLINWHLEPEIFSFEILRKVAHRMQNMGIAHAITIPVHIKIDTGMHRLGFDASEIPELVAEIKAMSFFKIKSVFSHLAASDETHHDDFTNIQIARFKELAAIIQNQFDYPIMRHICNSAAITRFPHAALEMVRLGISLYGVASDNTIKNNLRNVSSLKSYVTQVKSVPVGDSIGYSRKKMATQPMQIAVVPVGYADGLRRQLSNGRGFVFVNGHKVPIVGNICMDMCMLDVTGHAVKEGDEVEIFGQHIPISEVAELMQTIPYEVLTGISARVKRVYYQE